MTHFQSKNCQILLDVSSGYWIGNTKTRRRHNAILTNTITFPKHCVSIWNWPFLCRFLLQRITINNAKYIREVGYKNFAPFSRVETKMTLENQSVELLETKWEARKSGRFFFKSLDFVWRILEINFKLLKAYIDNTC